MEAVGLLLFPVRILNQHLYMVCFVGHGIHGSRNVGNSDEACTHAPYGYTEQYIGIGAKICKAV